LLVPACCWFLCAVSFVARRSNFTETFKLELNKMNKLPLLAATLVAGGVVTSANAAFTVVRITGSTAYRANVNNLLNTAGKVFDNAPTLLGPAFSAGASQLVFSNTISGANVIIKTSFTGSEAGIASLVDVAVPNNVSGQPNANLPGTPQPSFLANDGSAGPDVSSPDISMADTGQSVSLTQDNRVHDVGIVGVVQFTWVKAKNNSQANWAHLVNVTLPQLNVLLGGKQDLSFVTGTSADFGTPLVVVGRNKGSGTRVNTLVDTLYGVGKAVNQYAVSPTYNNGVLVTAVSSTPINDTAIVSIGNDGFDSGKGVAQTMLMTAGGGALTTIPIGYLGLGDANSVQALVADGTANAAAPAGGQYLTLNGVLYSDQAINNGAYDFWGHEHVLTGPFTSTTGTTVANSIKANLPATALGGSSGLAYALNVTLFADRPGGGDQGFVTPL
jgi:hypothetical protein